MDGGPQESTAGPDAAVDPLDAPPQSPLFHSLEQPRYARQTLLRALQERTNRRIIAYIGGPYSSITQSDVPPFVDLLHDVSEGEHLDLILQTPGGDVDQAERIVLMCRKKIGPTASFRVIVPDSAKSAGTLIALAADEIVMGYCSELGPIDPQITIATASGEPMSRPAHSFLDGLEEIVETTGHGKLSTAYFPLLEKLDPALIDFCKKAIKRSAELAERFLSNYMLDGDADRAAEIAGKLNDNRKLLSHGAVINADAARELGLMVNELPPDDVLWQAYWRLYCEMRLALTNAGQRLYEGQRTSLLIN